MSLTPCNNPIEKHLLKVNEKDQRTRTTDFTIGLLYDFEQAIAFRVFANHKKMFKATKTKCGRHPTLNHILPSAFD